MRSATRTALLAGYLITGHAYAGDVVLDVRHVTSNDGALLGLLFAGPEGFPSQPDAAFAKARGVATVSGSKLVFPGVPPGTYAAIVVHDVNGNGTCDLSWPIPFPKEPFAATRGARGVMGPPKFADAAFRVDAQGTVQIVTLP